MNLTAAPARIDSGAPVPIQTVESGPASRPPSGRLQARLRRVIHRLDRSIKTSQLISINLSLLVGRHRERLGIDFPAINVVATEIQRLSEEGRAGIDELDAVLDSVRMLGHTINKAGRQRMLSQMLMKLHLLRRLQPELVGQDEFAGVVAEFERSTRELQQCALNTPEIDRRLADVREQWGRFLKKLENNDLAEIHAASQALLDTIQQAVKAYEALST